MLKKIRLYLDIHKEKKIYTLQKYEAKLKEKLERPGLSLDNIKEDLQLCVISYQRIRAMAMVKNYIKFLEDKTLLITKAFNDPSILKELLYMMKGVGWALYKMNSDLAPEYLNFFARIIGDVTRIDNQIDRVLYYLLAWAIPQDLECIKYLRGFFDRNNIPVSSINHYGWFGPDIDAHILQLEKAEITRSKIRSNFKGPGNPPQPPYPGQGGVGNQPPKGPNKGQGGDGGFEVGGSFGGGAGRNYQNQQADPYAAQNVFTTTPTLNSPTDQSNNITPALPTDKGLFPTDKNAYADFPPAPLNECTQAELGIEAGEKYKDNFDKDLDFLKQDFAKVEKDPQTSEMFHDIKRREALKPEDTDKAFLDALNALKVSAIIGPSPTDGVKNDNLPNPYNFEHPTDGAAGAGLGGNNPFGIPDRGQQPNPKTDSIFIPMQPPHSQPNPYNQLDINRSALAPTQFNPHEPSGIIQTPQTGAATAKLTTSNHDDFFSVKPPQQNFNTQVDQRGQVYVKPQSHKISDKDFIALLKRVGV